MRQNFEKQFLAEEWNLIRAE